MIIGERIAKRLHLLGMSQGKLARAVGVSQPTISDLIHGKSYSSSHLHQIARVLRTTPAYLEGETDDPSCEGVTLTIEEAGWLNLLNRLSARDLVAVLQLAQTLLGGEGSTSLNQPALTFRGSEETRGEPWTPTSART